MSDFNLIWEELFGQYTPIEITNTDGIVDYMVDFGYIARVVFFIVVVYCILRMIGGVLTHDKR